MVKAIRTLLAAVFVVTCVAASVVGCGKKEAQQQNQAENQAQSQALRKDKRGD